MVSGGDFVEGIYFYWISWLGWIITTFFMRKCRERTVLSFVILMVIAVSDFTFQAENVTLRTAFLILLLFSFVLMAKTKGLSLLYYLISSLIISIGYGCFHLFELFDPVWLILDRKWMLAFIVLYLTLMLAKDYYYRMTIAIIGFCNGELLYSLILNKFSFAVELGDFPFLDALAVSLLLLSFWSLLEKLALVFEANFQKGKARRVHR